MASRYIYTGILKEKNTKKNYLETTIYPMLKPNSNDVYIIATEGDRIDLLAYRYYGETRMWWVIAVANNLNDANLFLEPGRQIRIPFDVTNVLYELKNSNI